MYTEVLRSISGIEIFPVISLVLFVLFFTGMLLWVWRLRAESLREYAGMPLDVLPTTPAADQPARTDRASSGGDRRDRETR